VAGDTTEVSVVAAPTFELPSGSKLQFDAHQPDLNCYSIKITDGSDPHPSIEILGKEVPGIFGLGAAICFGPGSSEPDTLLSRSGPGVLDVLGAGGQLRSNSPRIDH